MKEIGGYMEFEQYHNKMLYNDAIRLNSGRHCLAYLIETLNITKIVLPYFICDAVTDLCKRYHLQIRYYHINEQFYIEPLSLCEDEWLYIVNYYGQLSVSYLYDLKKQYCNVIIDNAQAYFCKPLENMPTLYTCRKFFGVPDGGLLYAGEQKTELEQDRSYQRMTHIMGRYEGTASEFFELFKENDALIGNEPIKKMSKLTQNILCSIDYDFVKKQRTENYCYLFEQLKDINLLKLRSVEGAYMYPLMLERASDLRELLIENKVYIPILWPNVIEEVSSDVFEYKLADMVLPLPCDQRYTISEMDYIIELIKKNI